MVKSSIIATAMVTFLTIPVGAQNSVPRHVEHFTIAAAGHVSVPPDHAVLVLAIARPARPPGVPDPGLPPDLKAAIARFGVGENDVAARATLVARNTGSAFSSGGTEFELQTHYEVTFRHLPRLVEFLDAVLKHKDAKFSALWFDVIDRQSHVDRAQVRAVQAARERAERYATAAGTKVGRLVGITESGQSVDSPVIAGAAGRGSIKRRYTEPKFPMPPEPIDFIVTIVASWAID